jgi:hypothetical protein
MSTDVGDALLGFRLGSGGGLHGKREDSCLLPFTEPRQQHDRAIRKLERVTVDVKRAHVDLAKDCNTVAGIGTKQGASTSNRRHRPSGRALVIGVIAAISFAGGCARAGSGHVNA